MDSRSGTTTEEMIASDGHLSVPILIPTAIIFVLTIFGLWGNGCIVWATFRNKSLQTVCNWLICYTSIADFIHQVGHATIFYFVLTGQNIVQLRYCYYWQFIPVFCMNLGVYHTLMIGLDRLLVIMFPTKHPFMSERAYLSIHLIIGFIYSFALLAMGYLVMLQSPEKEVVCVIMIELYQGIAKTIWVIVTVFLVTLVVFVYAWFWYYIRFSNIADGTISKAMKSVTVVVVILVFGWVISSASRVTCLLLNVDDRTLTYVLLWSAIATNIGCSSNYYVYYWISSEYRNALKKQLHFVFKGTRYAHHFSATIHPSAMENSMHQSKRRLTVTTMNPASLHVDTQ